MCFIPSGGTMAARMTAWRFRRLQRRQNTDHQRIRGSAAEILMRPDRSPHIWIWIAVFLLFIPMKAAAQPCSDALSTLVAAALRPMLDQQQVCGGLRHEVKGPFNVRLTVAADKTDKVELRSLRYCPTDEESRLEATVYVKCRNLGRGGCEVRSMRNSTSR
jgi:hypothetical protein